MPAREGTYGLLAEFDTPGDLVRAARQARQDGWRRMDCYTPYPVEEAAEAIGFHRNKVPLVTLIGGLMGGAAMFALETWISVLAYPLNIAGRPTYSWPAFIVPAYEWTILWAGLSAAFGMLALNGLPALYHPLFNAPNFRDGATTDKFFLCLEALDPKFDLAETKAYLQQFQADLGGGGGVLMSREQGSGIRDQAGRPAPSRFAREGGRPFAFATITCLLLIAGCRQDMQDQPKMVPQRGTDFFADHRGARPQVLNTVARGQLHEDSYFYTGVVQGAKRLPPGTELIALPGDDGSAQARAGALQHLLHAVPLAGGQRAGRDCAARLQAGGKSARPGAHVAAALALLLRDDARLRRHARLLGATDAGGPLGGGGLHSRPAAQPGSDGCRMCRPASQIRNLKDLAADEGHPEYAQPWPLPSTAVQAYQARSPARERRAWLRLSGDRQRSRFP